jgi:multiple sugar transport system ATP-binding protein
VFLFDEPLSNLDAKARLQMRMELKCLQRRLKTTTIYVTHDQEEAMSLGDRVLVMKAGRLQQCGRPQEVYDRPANRFVAGFIGMPSMSFLDGSLQAGNGQVAFVTGPLRMPLPMNWSKCIASRAGQSVVLGIRPEGLRINGDAEATFRGHVNLIENLGAFRDVYITLEGGQSIVGRMDSTPPVEGDYAGLCQGTLV